MMENQNRFHLTNQIIVMKSLSTESASLSLLLNNEILTHKLVVRAVEVIVVDVIEDVVVEDVVIEDVVIEMW